MDAISAAIVVVVLSLGFLLVSILKIHFNRRQNIEPTSVGNKRTNKQQQSKTQAPPKVPTSSAKQVPPEPVPSGQQPTISNHLLTRPTSNQNDGTKQGVQTKSSGTNSTGNLGNHVKTISGKQPTTRTAKRQEHGVSNPRIQSELASAESNGLEPSPDELDSSVLLGVFNPTSSRAQNKLANTLDSCQPHSFDKKPARKRQNSEQSNYSSEQLFTLIAASNLSKDEVEVAVETLLNKIESGESDWKQPKSDPLLRLKKQLRDNELALSMETQNLEQTRARLTELRAQLQKEKLSSSSLREELAKSRKEVGVVSLAMEQAHNELNKQKILYKQLKEDSSQVIAKLEQERNQLQSILANTNSRDIDLSKLRKELEDKVGQIQRYELSSQTMAEKTQELEAKLHNSEIQLDQMRSSKQHDEYEACAKMSELESDRVRLEKALNDQIVRYKEVSETNNLLEKSVKELQIINERQEEIVKRLRDERHFNEASMKRTLNEMEQELKELQGKLSANCASQDEKFRKEMSAVEMELGNADLREQELRSELRELRDGLASLLPESFKRNELESRGDSWVRQYLAAVSQLTATVEELRKQNNNNNNDLESPTKKSADKSTLTVRSNGNSPRVGSPNSNGRSSRGSQHDHNGEKKNMETKLLELSEYASELEEQVRKLEEEKQESSSQSYLQQIKSLKLQRNKLEAQIKFGLDSLKMEQAKVQSLEEELSKCMATTAS